MLRVARWESLRVALAFRSIVSTPCFYLELVVFAGCAALWSGGTVLVLFFWRRVARVAPPLLSGVI